MTTVAHQIATRHFGARLVKTLAKSGILVTATTTIPGPGPMPMANGETGYVVKDNGTQRALTAAEVRALAA